jgi:hypothetical protein
MYQRWASSTRNSLQLKESRKYDAAVKWPRWLPCLHAPEKVLSLGPAVAFSLNSQLPPDTAKHFPDCGQESHTFVYIGHTRVNLDNHHTHPYVTDSYKVLYIKS